MVDFKFYLGDIVLYKKQIYKVIGMTKYLRKEKNGLIHENTYALTPATIGNDYWFYTPCREHHIELQYRSTDIINNYQSKFNLGDKVTIKKGGAIYTITSKTEHYDGNCSYELMRITDSGHEYFVNRLEEYIEEKIKEV